ncbi:MAG: hypothetical protein MR388_00425 [Tenericutes bacterium]|nr:hypothetical protein [Mycoplasmatota bacterium]
MKCLNKLLCLILFLFLTIELIVSSDLIMVTIKEAIHLWFYKVVPALLPFFLFSNFLMNYGFIEITSEFAKPIMSFFKLNENAAFILMMSMLTGSPGNAFYIKEALKKGKLNEKEATKILMISQFASPLFILGTVRILLNDFKLSILILIITYITNFILAFLFQNFYASKESSSFSFFTLKRNFYQKETQSFGKTLSSSIKKTFDTLITILGSICFFYMITAIIQHNHLLPTSIMPYFSGILEMTQGINQVSLLNCSNHIKVFCTTVFLSFGGFSIHSQILSLICDTKIKYFPYLVARILHAMIAGSIILILLCYF